VAITRPSVFRDKQALDTNLRYEEQLSHVKQ
jgi:hypothetical protein